MDEMTMQQPQNLQLPTAEPMQEPEATPRPELTQEPTPQQPTQNPQEMQPNAPKSEAQSAWPTTATNVQKPKDQLQWYLMEDEDGEMISVREDLLEKWKASRARGASGQTAGKSEAGRLTAYALAKLRSIREGKE